MQIKSFIAAVEEIRFDSMPTILHFSDAHIVAIHNAILRTQIPNPFKIGI